MSKAKKIISMLLAVAMVLTVAPVSVLASAADVEYTYGDVSFSKTNFTVDTSATTDVIRIAASAGSFSVPASGTAGTIVAATPSGIPQNSGTYASVAYAKETPAQPQVSFAIDGVVPDAVPTVSATGINGFTYSLSGTQTSGSKTTYTWNITAGTATVGTDVVFTITYLIKGTAYTAYAFSHVEHILVMPGWASYIRDTNGTATDSRMSVVMQVQSKNMYTYMNTVNNSGTATSYGKTRGYVNYATTKALYDADGSARNALLGLGNEENVDGTQYAYVSAVPNNAIGGDEVEAFIKIHRDGNESANRYNGCLADDGNLAEPIIYIDKRNETIRSLNMRVTVQAGEAADYKSFTLAGIYFKTSFEGFSDDTSSFSTNLSTSILTADNRTSGSNNSATVTLPSGSAGTWDFSGYAMAPLSGTGPSTSLSGTNPYQMIVDVTATCAGDGLATAGSINLDFRVYDSTVLWNVYYGVLHGKALDGNASYTTPSDWASAPNFQCNFGKGANPQASMYTSGWDNYLANLKIAGSLLAKPDVTQAELDAAAVNLYVAYDALQGYNATVNWQINHYIEGTTTPIIPTQTVDPIATVYGQAQPAGSVWIANAATITGYSLSSTSQPSQNMTISGLNATETFTFYYKANEYDFIVDPNVEEDDSDLTNSPKTTGTKIYEDSLDEGTKPFYTFKGWYFDDGVWSQPVFSDSQAEGGVRYYEMPAKNVTIYARWEATPIDIEYVPIADGVVLDSVFIDGDEVSFDGGTTAQLQRPADLSVDGYLFVNYYFDEALTTVATFPVDFTLGVTENPYKLYARMVDVNGKISFESNGGTAVPDINFSAGQTVNPSAYPYLKGYTFAGWYTKATADAGIVNDPPTPEYFENGTQANGWTDGSETMADNTGFIAYAMYTPNSYTISYDLGDTTTKFDTESLPSITGLADSEIAEGDMPAIPKKFGYVFHHWELNGERYDLKTYPTEDITLTPYWVESDYSAFIDITSYEKLSGNYIETTTAQTDDVVTFRMTSQTNFYTGSSLFVFMYDKDFFELVDTDNAAFKLNANSEYISGIDATHLGVTTDSSLPWPSSLAAARNDYNAMMVAIDPQVTSTNYTTAPMNDGEWIVEFQLRVKSTATGTGKVYMSNDWTRTPDNIMGTMFYGWSNSESDVYNTYNNVVIPDLDYAFAEISIDETVTPDTTVKLNSNNGAYADSTTSKEYTGRAETEIMDYEAPTRTGYELTGWTNAADGSTVDWVDEFYYPATGTAEYDANWEAKKYSVTFYKDETLATTYYKTEYAYDSEVTGPPATPAKEGYDFRAWVNTETGEEITLPYICNGEASYYPVYDPSPNTKYVIKINYTNNMNGTTASTTKNLTGTTGYNVVIDSAAGSAANTIYHVIGDSSLAVANYEFDPDNNTLPITGTIAPDGSLVLELNYKAATINATVKANGGTFADGSDTATISGPFQSLIDEADLPVPTRDGYNFLGWGNSFVAGTTRYTPGRTITAQWEAIKYTMTFDAGTGAYADGTTSKTAEATLGGTITAPEIPTLKGWTFVGWSLNGGDATTTLGTLDKAENRTYTAVFEKTPYNINYYVDGVLDTDRSEVKYIGDTVTIASEPTKNGYEFGGWTFGDGSEATGFTITEEGDVDIYGEFTAKEIDVIFDANGGYFGDDRTATTATVKNTFDETIDAFPATNPLRDGHSFLGWAASADDAAAKNTITSWPTITSEEPVTFYAVWKAEIWTYNVEFYYQDVNGKYGAAEEDQTLELQGQVASEVSYNPDQTKEGFTLDTASSTLSGIVSVEDPLVLVVKYARNQHTLTIDIDGTQTTSQVYYGAAVTVPADPEKDGYNFGGWSNYTAGMTMPDSDLTITATWTAKPYTVTYYLDDTKSEVAYTLTAAYKNDYNVPEPGVNNVPTKEGYTFVNWALADTGADSGLEAGTVTQIPLNGGEYYAVWQIIKTPLVYRAQNGSFPSGDATVTFQVDYGTPQAEWPVPDENPVRTGYAFGGWNLTSAPTTMGTAQVNIVPIWNQETYNVIFKDSLSTDIYSEESLVYNDPISIPEDPEKEGYTFLYWTDAEGNEVTPADVMADIGESGVTLTYIAEWQINEHTITFKDTGDVAYAAITKNYGEAIGTIADPVKTGYTFLNWDTEIPATMPDEDLVITAKWKINQYTISFVDTGDVAYEAITQDYNTAVTAPKDPTKTGYTFAGWDKAIPTVMPAENTVVTAQWTINQYTISFADTGDVAYEAITQDYNTAVTAPANPTKTGYTFTGWDKAIPTVMPAENTVITAQWKINQYTISFVDTGDVAYEAITQDYNTAVTAPANPTKTGYTFAGWDKAIPTVMPAEDTVVTAQWTIDQYTITFDMDGGDAIAAITQDYNTAIDATAIKPNKTGYTFDGWVDANGDATDIPATMPAKSITLKATWKINQYTITFNMDGGDAIAAIKQDYNSSIDATAIKPNKTGYTFDGWVDANGDAADIPATMPAEDITLKATWKINQYTVTFLKADGSEFESFELDYNATITAPTGTPDKEFYTFVGWSLTELPLGTADTPVDTTALIDFENAAPTVIADDMTIYPAFDRVTVTLKLVAGSTAVVDKDRAADPVTGYIYGLRQKLKVAALTSEYLAVEGDGRLEVTPTMYGRCGTGTKVEVIDNVTDEVVEVYYIIIYGDVNGDSAIDASDVSAINAEDAGITNWSKAYLTDGEYDYCKVLAADIAGVNDSDGDGVDDDGYAGDNAVTVTDSSALNLVVLNYKQLDQTSGVIS